jgi:hypothetical protein
MDGQKPGRVVVCSFRYLGGATMPDTSYPWLKFYTTFLDDPKLNRVSERARWRYIQCYLLAGKADAEGLICCEDELLTINDISWRLRAEPATIEEDLSDLVEVGLLKSDNGAWVVTRFTDEQGPTQAAKREQWRERQRRHRERTKNQNKDSEEDEEEDGEEEVEVEVDLDLKKEKEEDTDKEVKRESRVTNDLVEVQEEKDSVVVFSSPFSKKLKTLNLTESEYSSVCLSLEKLIHEHGEDKVYDCFFRWAIEEQNMTIQKAINVIRKMLSSWEVPEGGGVPEPPLTYTADLKRRVVVWSDGVEEQIDKEGSFHDRRNGTFHYGRFPSIHNEGERRQNPTTFMEEVYRNGEWVMMNEEELAAERERNEAMAINEKIKFIKSYPFHSIAERYCEDLKEAGELPLEISDPYNIPIPSTVEQRRRWLKRLEEKNKGAIHDRIPIPQWLYEGIDVE